MCGTSFAVLAHSQELSLETSYTDEKPPVQLALDTQVPVTSSAVGTNL